jgi:hypothetical protein
MAATVGGRSERRASARVPKTQDAQRSKPSEDEIRILAYNLYERRCADGTTGDAASDWTEAERLLSRKGADVD